MALGQVPGPRAQFSEFQIAMRTACELYVAWSRDFSDACPALLLL